MPESIAKFAFSAGELSPALRGRGDLEKYDLGLAECYNYFVDYRGGITTRPGTSFIDYVMDDDKAVRFIPFKFSPDVANTYLLVFGHEYVRFVQDGAYVLEADVSISDVTQADPGVVTASGHGYSTGDWIQIFGVVGMTELNSRTFEVGATTSSTFALRDPFGDDLDTSGFGAYASGGTVNRIHTVTTPYAAEDLATLKAYQRQDVVFLRHPDYAARKLTRSGATSWALAEDVPASPFSPIQNPAIASSSGGGHGYIVTVTAVDYDGQEGLPAIPAFIETGVDFNTAGDQLKYTWDIMDGAAHYNVYGSLAAPDGTDINKGFEMGFLGRAYGAELVNGNIQPDFTKSVPQHRNPFADGAITRVDVTAKGSGYAKDDTVSVSGGGGSGFVGYPIVNDAGEILGVQIIDPGSGYSSPTVSFGTSTGSGATATAEARASTGNNPSTVSIFEQRKVEAGTVNQPMTVFGSRPGDLDNFDVSLTSDASDAYTYTIDDEEVAPIRHLIPTQNGLIVASKSGAWLLAGTEGKSVSAIDARATPISFNGFSQLEPLKIDTDIVYSQEGGSIVKALVSSEFSSRFKVEDLSILSNHLLQQHAIENWAWAEDPFRLLWAQRADGVLLTLTHVRDQNVFAWARHATRGLVRDVEVVQEGAAFTVYLLVERLVNGRWTKFIEQLEDRVIDNVEEAWAVDAGLALALPTPAADLTMAAASGDGVTFTASASVFAAGDVGKIIRAGGGKAEVVSFVSGTEVTVDFKRDATDTIPEDADDTPLIVDDGDWTMAAEVTTVSGLWHLEGETVRIFADGSVQPDKVVADGGVTLDQAASKVLVGLPYTARAKTLPIVGGEVVIQDKRHRVIGVAARILDTRGIKVGSDGDTLYEMKDRTTELWGEPTRLQTGVRYTLVEDAFDDDGSVVFQQDYPLPATLLGLVINVDIGDADLRSD